ncbi:hypothetical protein [Acinetobacter sp. ANC 5600]|uniref:hypothetical protein n=1 Tax=Acinetobacter sp. ANC 5600 TaxID=1960940 RepID=UPI000991E766|nr:hypothetical protein [Acinetobacter sp. ANC 5600]OOV81433.1 hypothetical protein B1201_10180 [Acinetobacter sp. ANC 5600]
MFKFYSLIMIGCATVMTCHANADQSTFDENVQVRWYEAVKHYDDVMKRASIAKQEYDNCQKKINCDAVKARSSDAYYAKVIADAKARLDAAERDLYPKIEKTDAGNGQQTLTSKP